MVYRPAKLTPEALEAGYWSAYRDFYRWRAIARGAWTHERWGERLRHAAYAGGWKKCEPIWDLIIRAKRASSMLPVLETVLAAFGARRPVRATYQERQGQAEQQGQPERQRRQGQRSASEPETLSEHSESVLVEHTSAVSSPT